MGKVVDALIEGTPLGKLVWDAIGVDAWWEVSVGKYVRDALIPIPDDDFGNEAMSQQQMLRSPTEARRSIYGKAMVSGPIVFVEETGTDNEFLHLVIPLAAHQCDAVLEIYFDDERVYQNGSLDAAYNEHARINIHLGAQTAADSDLQAECEHWTASHIGLGITYLYVRLKHDPEFYANGLPNIKALVQGKPLYDPRKDSTVGGSGSHRWDDVSTWEWSDNWALCVLDYTRFESGVGALANEMDLPSYALAANDSDQLVEYDDEGNTEKRYTCNGTFTQSMTPASVLDKLLTAGVGMQTYSSGKYQLFSGVYQGPHLLTLSEADLAGEVEVRPFNARAQLCNAVRGTFVDPENFYQPTDFAPYESDYYRAQDNNEYIDHDIDLPFTQSAYTAQRLAKLYLELNRAGQQIVVPLNMIGLSVSVGQVVELDLPRLGIKAEYQVMDWSFDFGQPIKVTLRETAAVLFDYDKGSYTDRKLTPVLNLPSSKRVPTVGGVVWTPLGDDANWQGLLSWNAPGGNSAYRYRLEVSDALDAVVYQATIEGTRHHIPKLDAGNYTVTLWAVNLFANRSNVPAIIAIGADAPPAVTGILVNAGALELTLRPQTAAITATTTEFEVKGGLSSDIANALFIGQGKEVIWPGRHANTQYFVWARATNNYGFSAWFGPIIAQTNSDKSALVELLGDTFEKFTWFAWADDAQGTGFTTNEAIGDGKPYMGIATDKKTASTSGNWQDYTWSKIQTEIPELFTPEEEAKLDNLMAGKLPAGDKEMLALQDALNDPKFNNNLLTAQQLLNQGIDAADLGGETPVGAQSKANAAEAAAALDALNKANTAKSEAIAVAEELGGYGSRIYKVSDEINTQGQWFEYVISPVQTVSQDEVVLSVCKTGLGDEYRVLLNGYVVSESLGSLGPKSWANYVIPPEQLNVATDNIVRIEHKSGAAQWGTIHTVALLAQVISAKGAAAKADAAQAAAEAYGFAQANLAEITAKAYADGKVSAEEARAIADAQAKADAAKNAAIAAAAIDAQGKADLAEASANETMYQATSRWQRNYVASDVLWPELLHYDGNSLPEKYLSTTNVKNQFTVSMVTIGTGTVSKTVGRLYWDGASWQWDLISAIGQSSNHPGIVIDAGVPKVRTWHPNNYTVSVAVEWRNITPGPQEIKAAEDAAKTYALAAANNAEADAINAIALGNFTANVGLISTLFANSGLFNQVKAKFGAFGGLTAETIASLAIATNHLQAGAVTSDKITADTALIQKLIANSGLFNQLQAQFALFGGLAANSIAAKAITVDKLDVRARNLVNNFSQTGESTGWSSYPIVSHIHKGQPTKAMQVSSSGNTVGYSDFFEIDHTKIYEVNFTIHRVSGGLIGTRYFGMTANGADPSVKAVNPDSRALGGSTTNFYFWHGDIADGQYRQMRCYIIGSEVDPASIPDSLNVSSNCQLNPSTTHVLLRTLNYYNGGVTTVDRWLNPSVTELGGGQISANQLLANSVLFNTLKSKLASFGGLTANEIKADTALINKLVGTSGLFNDLVARLAVFGGLTANSIASDAILGRHIKAGERIESPIIEGGQFRNIGPNTMKVESETPFGPDSLVEWRGPKLLVGSEPDWANLRKSNATRWTDSNGDEYFGGSLSSGILRTGVTNPDKNFYVIGSYPVTIGPFGTNGSAKSVVVAYVLNASYSSSSYVSNPTQPSLSWQLQRKVGTGSWVTVASGTFSGTTSVSYNAELNRYTTQEYCSGSSTYTDNSTSTSDFHYQVKIISQSRYHASQNVSQQTLTVVSTEQ